LSEEAYKTLLATTKKVMAESKCKEVKELLRKALNQKRRMSKEDALIRWKSSVDFINPSDLHVLNFLKERRDRVDYARYLFTGCIFTPEAAKCGNPTLKWPGEETPKCFENLFRAMPINFLSLDYEGSMERTLEANLIKALRNMRDKVALGSLKVTLERRSLSMKSAGGEAEKLSERHSLTSVDWSGIADYERLPAVVAFIQRCNQAHCDTIHLMQLTRYPKRKDAL